MTKCGVKTMINQDAFDLICDNMKETPVNNKKTFARFMVGEKLDDFSQSLMEAWCYHAKEDDVQRLAIAYPQIANAMLEYNTLPEKKRGKYLDKLLK